MIRSAHWASPGSSGFGKESIKLQLGDREIERIPQRDSWELSDGSMLSLCARGKDFRRFTPEGQKLWETGIYAGDDVRHPVVARDTLYYFSYNGAHAVDLETGQNRYDRAPSIWRDVWASRDGHLVTVEGGELIVRDEHLKERTRADVPFTINRAVHHQNQRMVTLTYDDKRLDHAVMSEDGEVLFESKKELVFRGSQADDHLWQVLADRSGCEVLHITPQGQASVHPVPGLALAAFGQPDGGFVTVNVPESEAEPLCLRREDGQTWSLGQARIDSLFACPDGAVLIAQEDGVRYFRDGQLSQVGTEPCLPAALSDGSFLLVTSDSTRHVAADGTVTPYPDAWAAREAIGGEVVSQRVHTVGMGLDDGTPASWHGFLQTAERVSGPPMGTPALGMRSTATRLDFVRSKQANSLAYASLRTATATDGTGLISAATLAIRNKELDLIVATASPERGVQAVNTWSAMALDKTPAAPTWLHLDSQGVTSMDQGGNVLRIEFGSEYQPVDTRPSAEEVASLARRMVEYRHESAPALPAVIRLLADWPELVPATNFMERIATHFPDLGEVAAREALSKPTAGEPEWLKTLARSSDRKVFGRQYLQQVRATDDGAELALSLTERASNSIPHDQLINRAMFESPPKLTGSALDQRVILLEWLTSNWSSVQLGGSARVLMELLFEKAEIPLDHSTLRRCAQGLQQKDVSITSWWRQSLQELKKYGQARSAVQPLAEGGPKHTGISQQGDRVVVGGTVMRTRY